MMYLVCVAYSSNDGRDCGNLQGKEPLRMEYTETGFLIIEKGGPEGQDNNGVFIESRSLLEVL